MSTVSQNPDLPADVQAAFDAAATARRRAHNSPIGPEKREAMNEFLAAARVLNAHDPQLQRQALHVAHEAIAASTVSESSAPTGERGAASEPSRSGETAIQALSDAGAFCGVCGFQPGDRGCPECEACWRSYVAALRKAGWAPLSEAIEAARSEYLHDPVPGDDSDEGYQCAVSDVIDAIDALRTAAEGGSR